MTSLKGKKTFLLSLLTMLLASVQGATGVLDASQMAIAVSVLGVLIAVLRAVTTTPPLDNGKPKTPPAGTV